MICYSIDLKPIPSSGSDFVPLPDHVAVDENTENLLGKDDLLANMQDDEISRDVTNDRAVRFYEDDLPILTDDTFNNTVSTTGLLVVLFYVPWDDASYLLQPIFARVHNSIGKK